jgi:hypothetical protein
MQIILLFLLSSMVFAQEICDPAEVERACFNQVCSPQNPKNIVLMDTSNVKLEPYKLSPRTIQNLKNRATRFKSIKQKAKKSLSVDKMAREILEFPREGVQILNSLFEGDLKCIQMGSHCEVVENNMVSYPSGLKDLYRLMNDAQFVFNADETNTSLSERKKLLLDSIDGLSLQKKEIEDIQTEDELLAYISSVEWFDDYQKKVAKKLIPFQKDLKHALEKKTKELLNVDTSFKKAKSQFTKSCQAVDFIKKTFNDQITEEKFNDVKGKALASFQKILPKMSEHSAKTLTQKLSSLSFEKIGTEARVVEFQYPVRAESDDVSTNREILEDLLTVTNRLDGRCLLDGYALVDKFDSMAPKVYISTFAIATESEDAIIHELGHWLYSLVKNNELSFDTTEKLLKVKDCVKGFYTFLDDKTEEDLADWVLAKTGARSQVACDLSFMIKKFKGNEESSYIPSWDPHSNTLFRELNIRMNRGETLPQSCTDLINAYPDFAPKRCDL